MQVLLQNNTADIGATGILKVLIVTFHYEATCVASTSDGDLKS